MSKTIANRGPGEITTRSGVDRGRGLRLLPTILLPAVLLAGAPATPAAADDPLVTDRPDFTESATAVAPGRVQVEAGATHEEAGDAEATSVGEVLVRIGLVERLELRLDAGSWVALDPGPGAATVDGWSDPGIGIKWELGALGTGRWALLAGTSVPIGSDAVGSEAWQPEAIVAAAWDLSPRLGLGANVGVGRPEADGQRFDQAFGSVALGVALGERWGAFAELYGFSREAPGGGETLYADAGLTRTVGDDLQLDLRLGTGLSGTETDLVVGAGLAHRW